MAARIPNVFHFVFGLLPQAEPFHLMHYLCLRSCLEVARPDAIHFHYHNEPHGPLWDAIRPHLVLRKIDPATPIADYRYSDPRIAAFRYAHISDFLRLRILIDEGGIYADMDTLFIRPMPEALRMEACVMGHEKPPAEAQGGGSLCNAFIAAEPNAGFCRLWLDAMEEAFDGSWSNHSTLLPYRLAQRHPELIETLPEAAFFALDWTPDGIDGLFLRETDLPEDTYSLHLWSHLWFDSGRRDFSAFSGDLLTADYVAFAGTTYARHARPFLPQAATASRTRYLAQRAMLEARRLHRNAFRLAGRT